MKRIFQEKKKLILLLGKYAFSMLLIIRKRPITRYLSNHSFLQYTVIKNKLEDFLCHNLSSH